MALPEIADTIRTAVSGTTQGGVAWANILHFRKTPVITYPVAIGVLDPLVRDLYTVAAIGRAAWQGIAPTGAALAGITYTPLDGASASTFVAHASAVVAGIPGEAPSVAMAVSLHTALRGKRNRGRVYWGPLRSSLILANGTLDPAYCGFVAAQWAAFLGSLVGTGLSLVVASYGNDTNPDVSKRWAPYATDVTTATVNARADTQRRRLGR